MSAAAAKKQHVVRCSKCGVAGHNARSCRNDVTVTQRADGVPVRHLPAGVSGSDLTENDPTRKAAEPRRASQYGKKRAPDQPAPAAATRVVEKSATRAGTPVEAGGRAGGRAGPIPVDLEVRIRVRVEIDVTHLNGGN